MSIRVDTSETLVSILNDDLKLSRRIGFLTKKTEKINFWAQEGETVRIPFGYAVENFDIDLPCGKMNSIPNSIVLRDYQQEIYPELKQHILQDRCAFLALYCGAGKTVTAIKLICELGLKTAIVCHLGVVFDQWVKVFKDLTEARIVIVDSSVKELPEDGDVYIFMVQAASKFTIDNISMIDFLVVDEALRFCTKVFGLRLLSFTPKYTLGLSADTKRKDGMHSMLNALFGKNVIRRISQKKFTVWKINTMFKPEIQHRRIGGKLVEDWNLIWNSMAKNKARNRIIRNICTCRPDDKILIMCKRKIQVEKLRDMLIGDEQDVETYYGKDKGFRMSRILIGTVNKCGMGFDYANKCEDYDGVPINMVILAADVADVEQYKGRGDRADYPEIVDFVDDFGTFRRHWLQRQTWYKSRNADIREDWF